MPVAAILDRVVNSFHQSLLRILDGAGDVTECYENDAILAVVFNRIAMCRWIGTLNSPYVTFVLPMFFCMTHVYSPYFQIRVSRQILALCKGGKISTHEKSELKLLV